MENAANRAVANLPEALRPSAALWFDSLQDRDLSLPPDCVAETARVVACSEFAAAVIAKDIDWFVDLSIRFGDRYLTGLLSLSKLW